MDKQTAKEILSAYRPSGLDASDENFEQALELCRRDPEMAKWLESENDLGQRFAHALGEIKGPASGRAAILATVEFEEKPTRVPMISRIWWRLPAAAAVIAVGFAVYEFEQGAREFGASQPTALQQNGSWTSAVAELANAALPLDWKGQDLEELQTWLTERGSPTIDSLPAGLASEAKLAGCRAFKLSEGAKVSLVCFRYEDELVHVFIVNKEDIGNMTEQENAWQKTNGWNLYTWSDDSRVMTLASKLSREALSGIIQGV